ncbi:MAG: hypothetical protein V3V00_15835 [Saprospiraceae bacterium]
MWINCIKSIGVNMKLVCLLEESNEYMIKSTNNLIGDKNAYRMGGYIMVSPAIFTLLNSKDEDDIRLVALNVEVIEIKDDIEKNVMFTKSLIDSTLEGIVKVDKK